MLITILPSIATASLDELKRELKVAEDNFNKFLSGLSANAKTILGNEDNIKKLNAVIPQIVETKQKIKNCADKIQQLKQKDEELQKILVELDDALFDNDGDVSDVENNLDMTNGQIEDITEKIKAKKGDLDALKKELENLEKLKDDLNSKLKELLQKKAELKEKYNAATSQDDEINNLIPQVEDEKNKAEITRNDYYYNLSHSLQPPRLIFTEDMDNFIDVAIEYIKDTELIADLKKKIDEFKPPKAQIMTKK